MIHHGVVDWYDRKLSYGFVAVGALRYFFHRKDIVVKPEEFQRLEMDDKVQFELGEFNGKVVAVKVRKLVNAPAIQGRTDGTN
jgi:cold shock CspA family protein